MRVKYYADTDSVRLVADAKNGRGGGDSLRDDFDVVVEYADRNSEDVVAVDVFNVSWYLPLRADRGYDAETDTLTLGDKPGNGVVRIFRQEFKGGSKCQFLSSP